MSDPLALLPLALAAGGGRIRTAEPGADDADAQRLVAAGLTLLQRSAPLVRALAGRRSAILLPATPAFLTALAASDGRGALLVDARVTADELAFQCADANVGALFTSAAFAPRLPEGMTTVLLDDSPRVARVVAGGETRVVDLGSHHGLSLAGERDVPGRDEEAAIAYGSTDDGGAIRTAFTHATLLADARAALESAGFTSADHVLALIPFWSPATLASTVAGPLLAGARVTTMNRLDAALAAELLGKDVTVVVGAPADFVAMLPALERHALQPSGSLRLGLCFGAPPPELLDRWTPLTGAELREL